MKIIRGLKNLPVSWAPCAVTVGKFDGLHLGHQSIVEQLRAFAGSLPTVVICFYPNPSAYFQPKKDFFGLQTKRQFIAYLSQLGIDYLLYLPFNKSTAEKSAEFFIEELKSKIKVQKMVVGTDFRFGKNRQGDVALIEKSGIEIKTPALLKTSNQVIISSSLLREVLKKSDFSAAKALLGRPYQLAGKVIRGDQIGRTLGFPTANIHLKDLNPVLRGVFAVYVFDRQGRCYGGVANLGVRPTVAGLKLLLEIHLFNCYQDLYGNYLTVEFLQKIREEQKFPSLEALKKQIAEDVSAAKFIVNHNCSPT